MNHETYATGGLAITKEWWDNAKLNFLVSSWSGGETCYRLYLSWLVFSLFHTITMPYRSDVASKFSPWFHATSPTGKRWPCSQKCTSWWEHGGGGEIVKHQMPVRNRDGPVACWRMYALAESNHRNKRLNPHFRQLHVKKKKQTISVEIKQLLLFSNSRFFSRIREHSILDQNLTILTEFFMLHCLLLSFIRFSLRNAL
jgi:hypothetical protein